MNDEVIGFTLDTSYGMKLDLIESTDLVFQLNARNELVLI